MVSVNARVEFNYPATENSPAMVRTGTIVAIQNGIIIVKQNDGTHRRFRTDRIVGNVNIIG